MTETIVIIAVVFIVLLFTAMGFKMISQEQIGVIERLGAYHDSREAGIHYTMPVIDRLTLVKKEQTQLIKQTINLNGVPRFNYELKLDYEVVDVKQYIYGSKNMSLQIESMVLKESRLFLEKMNDLTDAECKVELTQYMQEFLHKENAWGVKIINFDLLILKTI